MPINTSPDPQIYKAVNAQAIRYGVPAAIWEDVAYTESGFNPNAIGDHGTSFGLFQLHKGGQLPAQYNDNPTPVFDPSLNAAIAMPAIGKAWANMRGSFDPNSDAWWQQFAATSGHPAQDGNTSSQAVVSEAAKLKANYPGPSTGVPTQYGGNNPLPWYCVNVGGNVMSLLPGASCEVIGDAGAYVEQKVSDLSTQDFANLLMGILKAVFAGQWNDIQAALPAILERIGLFLFALILVVVGFIMLVHP